MEPVDGQRRHDCRGDRRVRFTSKKKRFSGLRKARAAAVGSRHESVHLLPGVKDAFGEDDERRVVDPKRPSLLRAELVRLSQLEKRRGYRERVHEPLWPLCQSLPEVLLHSSKICRVLGEVFASEETYASAFVLASVLARDAGEALESQGLDELVEGIVRALRRRESTDDVARAAFAALSYVFRYCAAPLLRGADETGWPAARRFYAPLLGGPTADARLLGARALATLVRRLSGKTVAKHVRRVLRALDAAKATTTQLETSATRLLFEVCRGVGGRLHSRAKPVFDALLLGAKTKKKKDERRGEVTERIATGVVALVLEDGRPGEEIDDLWDALVAGAREATGDARAPAVDRLRSAIEWRTGRLVTPRGDDDAALPPVVAARRAADLRDTLDALCDATDDRLLGPTLRLTRAVAETRRLAVGTTASNPSDRALVALMLADAAPKSPALAQTAYAAAAALASEDPSLALLVAARAAATGAAKQKAEEEDDDPLSRLVATRLAKEEEDDDDDSTLVAALAAFPALAAASSSADRVAHRRDREDAVVRAAAVDALGAVDADRAARLALSPLASVITIEGRRRLAPSTLRCAADALDAASESAAVRVDHRPQIVDALVETGGRLALRVASSLEEDDDGLKLVLESFRRVDELPVGLASERRYAKLLSDVEVLCRRADLATRVARAAAIHALRLLRVKFEPLWGMAKKILETLATSHPVVLWPRLLDQLRNVCATTTRAREEESRAAFREGRRDDDAGAELRRAFERASQSPEGTRFAEMLARGFDDDDDDDRLSRGVDADRAHEILWDAARRCGVVSGRPGTGDAARAAVDLVLAFVRCDYVRVFDDDPDAREAAAAVVVGPTEQQQQQQQQQHAALTRGSAYKRLETVLGVFSEAQAPRSLPRCDVLRLVYERLLSKPGGQVAKRALACLRPYKLPHLTPYANRLEAMLDDKTLRDTLVKMKIGAVNALTASDEDRKSEDKWFVDDAHRADLAPLLCRVLFGRFRAKSSAVGAAPRRAKGPPRDDPLVRGGPRRDRARVLRLSHAPPLDPLAPASVGALREADVAERAVSAAKPSRVFGVLQLIRAMAPRFGFKAERGAPAFLSLALAAVRALRDEREHWELRGGLSVRLWSVVAPHLEPLLDLDKEASLAGGEPVVVELIASLAATRELKPLLADESVRACCVRAAGGSKLALGAMCALVLGDANEPRDVAARELLRPHSRTVVVALTAAVETSSKKKALVLSSKSSRTALEALCRVAALFTSNEWPLDAEDASALASALAPRLLAVVDSSAGVDPAPFRNSILDCLGAILPRVAHAARHVDEFVTLLAPPRPRRACVAFFAAPDALEARRDVARACVKLMRAHPALSDDAALGSAADLLAALAGIDGGAPRATLEPEYDARRRPLFPGDEATWTERQLLGGGDDSDLAAAPIVAHCKSTMRSGDPGPRRRGPRAARGVCRRGATPTRRGGGKKKKSDDDGLGAGVITAIVVGIVAFLLCVAVALYVLKNKSDEKKRDTYDGPKSSIDDAAYNPASGYDDDDDKTWTDSRRGDKTSDVEMVRDRDRYDDYSKDEAVTPFHARGEHYGDEDDPMVDDDEYDDPNDPHQARNPIKSQADYDDEDDDEDEYQPAVIPDDEADLEADLDQELVPVDGYDGGGYDDNKRNNDRSDSF
ncbi:hypothetical protein CTAYLR_006048 [Chrysophaeum taylorii]|uniref:U3 small nucleolar RNA-associated protein 20 N-terminal domain-containing protein n=1 Tax=Chrysophaeum taylorii TaxID=2483200 RepID=A0AAD7UJC6_9STRA|nr:hypothetical protein CTAYLR_006048 [Chrysophaeum taylorii]